MRIFIFGRVFLKVNVMTARANSKEKNNRKKNKYYFQLYSGGGTKHKNCRANVGDEWDFFFGALHFYFLP